MDSFETILTRTWIGRKEYIEARWARGKSLIVNTTECIHKAGVPNFGCYRDILFITFIVTPKKAPKAVEIMIKKIDWKLLDEFIYIICQS